MTPTIKINYSLPGYADAPSALAACAVETMDAIAYAYRAIRAAASNGARYLVQSVQHGLMLASSPATPGRDARGRFTPRQDALAYPRDPVTGRWARRDVVAR